MEYFKIMLTALGSAVALFILTKIMGKRQMSQLNMFDYINGITIGSIAAEMATSLENDFTKPLLAMVVYTVVSVVISFSCNKSIVLRRILDGKSIILMNNGKIYADNLQKAHLDINEFLVQCRIDGYFNIADIQTAVLETNGKISFLPMADKRPISPYDMNIKPLEEKMVLNVIIDGNIMEENLKYTGNNRNWLDKQLEHQKVKASEIILATCDVQNELKVYKKDNSKNNYDPFQ
ncbi:MAG: DUF421 domain-containing protein [Oscillospiraceae bacterium]